MKLLKNSILLLVFLLPLVLGAQPSSPPSTEVQEIVLTTAESEQDTYAASRSLRRRNFSNRKRMLVYLDQTRQSKIVTRSFLNFDMDEIPENAIITEAELQLTAARVDNGSSHAILIERVRRDWDEDTLTWKNKPGAFGSDGIRFSSNSTSNLGLQTFDLTEHVIKMHDDPERSFGWRIRLRNENRNRRVVRTGMRYFTSNHANTNYHPKLVVKYIIPLEIEAEIQHATVGNNDASITPSVIGGSGEIQTFLWWDENDDGSRTLLTSGSTEALKIDSLGTGVFILEVRDALFGTTNQDDLLRTYKRFLIGREGETTTVSIFADRNAGENFIEDASIFNPKGDNSDFFRSDRNYGRDVFFRTTQIPETFFGAYDNAALLQYFIDFNNELVFSSAELELQSAFGHFRTPSSTNESYLSRVNDSWDEMRVTWDTRPSIDSSARISLEQTGSAGFTFETYSLDIIDFVEFWQENPNQNHGVELALKDFADQTAPSRLGFASSDVSNGKQIKFTLSYSVDAQELESTFNDTTNTGTLTVNAPSGNLPYTYLINGAPLGELIDVWNELDAPQFVDSISFFEGNINAETFTFENLPPGEYFTSVYDNDGVKIFEGNGTVNTEILLLDENNLTQSADNVFARGTEEENGNGRLFAELHEFDEFGGINFEVVELGQFCFGFNKASDPVSNGETGLEFGMRIMPNGTYQVVENNSLIQVSGNISVGSRVGILKDNEIYKITIDQVEVYSSDAPLLSDVGIAVDLVAVDAIVKLKVINYVGSLKPPGISINVDYPECGQSKGDIFVKPSVSFVPSTFVTISSSVAVNNETGESFSNEPFVGFIGETAQILDLPIGTYTLTTTYSFSGGFSFTYTVSEQIAIGYIVEWTELDGTAIIDGTENTIRPLITHPGFASANSTNVTEPIVENWIQFEVRVGFPSITVPSIGAEVFQLRNINDPADVAFGLSSVSFLNSALSSYSNPDPDFNPIDPTGSSATPNGVWRIDQTESEFSIYKENNFLQDGTSSIGGPYEIRIDQAKEARYITTIASFCGNFPIPDQYVEPTRSIRGGFFLVPSDDILKFEFNEEYNLPGNLNYTIRNFTGEPIEGLEEPVEVFGDNRFSLDLSSLSGGTYLMEIENDKGEDWFIRFRVQ